MRPCSTAWGRGSPPASRSSTSADPVSSTPFGSLKQWMNQGAFLMRRLDNIRGEFSLTALATNVRRAINLIGVPGLIAAAKG